MKKTILLLACLVGVLSSQAQTNSGKQKDKKITFGLRAGYEFQGNDSNLNYNLNLPYLGVFSGFKLSEHWSLQLELNLRSEKRERIFNNGFRESLNELYFTAPVLLKYYLNNRFKIYVGTQVLSASLKTDVLGIKKANGILGAEYNLNKNFFLDVRFRHGFEGQRSINNFRDNRIGIGLGYKF